MQQNIKMLTLIRKDFPMRRDKLLDLISKSSCYFFLENNESTLNNQLYMNLSHDEISWIDEGQKRVFAWKSNEEDLRSVSFHAEMNGISQFKIFDDTLKSPNGESSSLISLTLGPCDWNEISKIAGKFKLI